MESISGFELTPDLAVQGLIGLFVFLWALKDAIPKYREMRKASHPDPIVTAMSLTWDRDMQERLLHILERMAIAAELQAKQQIEMADSWDKMADHRQHQMNERITDLLKALEDKENQLSAMHVEVRGRPRR